MLKELLQKEFSHLRTTLMKKSNITSIQNPPSCSPNHDPLAAAAKSLQSCPTLCDPMDCSPPGSPVHGIFQARVLEWVAIAFSDDPLVLLKQPLSLFPTPQITLLLNIIEMNLYHMYFYVCKPYTGL